MPININSKLPAAKTLADEGIFIMPTNRAQRQDIRPLRILILNIMPTKEQTETQLMRLLANSPLQVEITLLHPATHTSKNTSIEHLNAFYSTFEQIKKEKYDGLIITGAPVEQIAFEEVNYWEEMQEIMEWSKKNVFSTLHICWAAQAGVYYHYGIDKHMLKEKMFGIFLHTKSDAYKPLLRGFDDVFWAPHSRHTEIDREAVLKCDKIEILCESRQSGIYILASKNGRQIFVTGHPEYCANTLKEEYLRDVKKGLDIKMPKNYFVDNNPSKPPVVRWRAHANLLFNNWLNYYVYQGTPFNIAEVDEDSK